MSSGCTRIASLRRGTPGSSGRSRPLGSPRLTDQRSSLRKLPSRRSDVTRTSFTLNSGESENARGMIAHHTPDRGEGSTGAGGRGARGDSGAAAVRGRRTQGTAPTEPDTGAEARAVEAFAEGAAAAAVPTSAALDGMCWLEVRSGCCECMLVSRAALACDGSDGATVAAFAELQAICNSSRLSVIMMNGDAASICWIAWLLVCSPMTVSVATKRGESVASNRDSRCNVHGILPFSM